MNKATKSAIIGKAWNNNTSSGLIPASFTLPENITFSAGESYLINNLHFCTNRNLNTSSKENEILPLSLPAGTQLSFFSNNKRPDRNDPDFSVSIRLPFDLAETIISNEQKGARIWRESHQAA